MNYHKNRTFGAICAETDGFPPKTAILLQHSEGGMGKSEVSHLARNIWAEKGLLQGFPISCIFAPMLPMLPMPPIPPVPH